MFNKKGQAFSVFNLLIAAVVSLAILGLLMGILSGGVIDVKNKPADTAAEVLKDAQNNFYKSVTKEATFDADSPQIAILFVENELSLGSGEIGLCVASEIQNSFNEGASASILYTGSNPLDVKITAICGEGEDIEALLRDSANGNETGFCAGNESGLCRALIYRNRG
jgi:hypothetical protein